MEDVSKNRAEGNPEYPNISEGHWYAIALSALIFTIIFVGIAFCVVFIGDYETDERLKITQTLSPFVISLFALVTFATVCWRAMITTRQADQAARQADQAEREGRVKLLQEGAKLLGESENVSHVAAGIATLELLVVGPDEKLAIQAMNLMADFIQANMADGEGHKFWGSAVGLLKTGNSLEGVPVFRVC